MAQHAAAPPGPHEARAVARELHVGGGDGAESHTRAAFGAGGVEADDEGEEREGQEQGPPVGAAQQGGRGSEHEQQGAAHGEDGGQEVDQLQRAGVSLREVDAGDARVVNLLEELAQVGAPLVPHPGFGEEPARVAALEDACGEVDVLAEPHVGEAAEGHVDLAAQAHVEGAGVELVHLLLAAADAAGGEEGSHGIVDGLLHRRERGVCAVGPAEGVAGSRGQFSLDGGEIARGQHGVGVEHDDVRGLRAGHAVVAGLARSAVLLHIIMYGQAAGVFPDNVLARNGRAVLHHHHFKIREGLCRQALQEFVHLIGAVEHGDD